jgi:pimeloyl-ACP methyl ester carboxylesterase
MILVSPDYRASTSWMGPKAEADLVQIIGLLRGKYKIGHVVLSGGSMGGTSALIFAALHPELIDGVVAENGTANMIEYDKFQDAIAASYGGNKKQKPEEYKKRSPELYPEQFKMPVAFTVGGKDAMVPPDSVRRLAAKLTKMKKTEVLLIDRPDGGHATDYTDTVAGHEFVMQALAARDAKKKAEESRKQEDKGKKASGAKDESSPKKGESPGAVESGRTVYEQPGL